MSEKWKTVELWIKWIIFSYLLIAALVGFVWCKLLLAASVVFRWLSKSHRRSQMRSTIIIDLLIISTSMACTHLSWHPIQSLDEMLPSKAEHWLALLNCRQAISARNASSAGVNMSFAADLLFYAHSPRSYVRSRTSQSNAFRLGFG